MSHQRQYLTPIKHYLKKCKGRLHENASYNNKSNFASDLRLESQVFLVRCYVADTFTKVYVYESGFKTRRAAELVH